MGKVNVGDSCYPKVLAESYGSVLSEKLVKRILTLVLGAIRDEVGLDLLSPDDEVRPGDRVVGRGGLDVEVQAEDNDKTYKEKYEEFIQSIAGILKVTNEKGWSESERADAVEERAAELLSRVSGVHEAMRKIDQTCDEEDACEGVVALVDSMVGVLESIRISVDGSCDIDQVYDNVVRMIDELEAVRSELGVKGVGEILPGVKKTMSELALSQESLRMIDQGCGTDRSVPHVVSTLVNHAIRVKGLVGGHDCLDSEGKLYDLLEELKRLKSGANVAAPLLERLLGSPEVTAESVAAALAALGPAPEF